LEFFNKEEVGLLGYWITGLVVYWFISFWQMIFFCSVEKPATALRSAGHLENVQPGTAADVSYKS